MAVRPGEDRPFRPGQRRGIGGGRWCRGGRRLLWLVVVRLGWRGRCWPELHPNRRAVADRVIAGSIPQHRLNGVASAREPADGARPSRRGNRCRAAWHAVNIHVDTPAALARSLHREWLGCDALASARRGDRRSGRLRLVDGDSAGNALGGDSGGSAKIRMRLGRGHRIRTGIGGDDARPIAFLVHGSRAQLGCRSDREGDGCPWVAGARNAAGGESRAFDDRRAEHIDGDLALLRSVVWTSLDRGDDNVRAVEECCLAAPGIARGIYVSGGASCSHAHHDGNRAARRHRAADREAVSADECPIDRCGDRADGRDGEGSGWALCCGGCRCGGGTAHPQEQRQDCRRAREEPGSQNTALRFAGADRTRGIAQQGAVQCKQSDEWSRVGRVARGLPANIRRQLD